VGACVINRHYLTGSFTLDDPPLFKCPRCNEAQLAWPAPLNRIHPYFSQKLSFWNGQDETEFRLVEKLTCSSRDCGDVVSVYAIGSMNYEYWPSGETQYLEKFRPVSLYPSPHIIDLPDVLPPNVCSNFVTSFNCYWSNPQLAGNCIRTSLEHLLTHFEIPSEIDDKWISLGNRLHLLAKQKPDDAEFLTLLKPVVNAGSHGEPIERDVLLDVYEALEIYLSKVFSSRDTRFNELKKRLSGPTYN
jgi:hypothetical protein